MVASLKDKKVLTIKNKNLGGVKRCQRIIKLKKF